jgi:broad-specificity NMP kinase
MVGLPGRGKTFLCNKVSACQTGKDIKRNEFGMDSFVG